MTPQEIEQLPIDLHGIALANGLPSGITAHPERWVDAPEPEDHQHAGDFPEHDEQPERCPDTDDMFGE